MTGAETGLDAPRGPALRTLCCALLLVFAGCSSPGATGGDPGTEAASTPIHSRTSVSTAADGDRAPGPPTATFAVADERRATVTLEVADSPAERERGLMGRRSLALDHGMVFVYDGAAPRSFWMKNTYVPLDMIFVGPDGRVLNVAHATPQPNASDAELRRYESAGPAKYVIEVRRGFANETGVGPGARVRFANATFETPGGGGA